MGNLEASGEASVTTRSKPDWKSLRAHHPRSLVTLFEELAVGGGRLEITRTDLLGRGNFTGEDVDRLVAELTRIDWLEQREQMLCPCCLKPITEPLDVAGQCPHCGQAFVDCGEGGLVAETVYVRNDSPPRFVAWVLTLHGMNTRGEWQEKFNWLAARSYSPPVPVAVYKYGMVRPGVLFRWRHRQLSRQVAERIRALTKEAEIAGYKLEPDVIAHSFGTLLLAKALEADETLKVERIILAGCILPPTFNWQRLIDRGQVGAVLNHYGTADRPVAVTHYLIPDSGPAGRRGFDTPGVINVEGKGYKHSTVFKDRMDLSFLEVWRPFLSASEPGALDLPGTRTPAQPWKAAPWGLRAGLGRLAVLAILAGIALLLAGSLTFGFLPFLRWIRGVL